MHILHKDTRKRLLVKYCKACKLNCTLLIVRLTGILKIGLTPCRTSTPFISVHWNNFKFGQLILSKIIKIVATRCHTFKAKMHQIIFRLGLCTRPHWENLQRSPDSLAGFKGPTSKGRGGGKRPLYLFLRIYAHKCRSESRKMSGNWPCMQSGLVVLQQLLACIVSMYVL